MLHSLAGFFGFVAFILLLTTAPWYTITAVLLTLFFYLWGETREGR